MPSVASMMKASSSTNTNEPHLMVEALAGCGKTTTLVESMVEALGQQSALTPSQQQKAVWLAVCKSLNVTPDSFCFCAFGKQIATELQRKVPKGIAAMTLHSLGLKAVTAALGRLTIPKGAEWVVRERVAKVMGLDLGNDNDKWDNWQIIEATRKMVDLCKLNLCSGTEEEIDRLAAHHDVDLNGSFETIVRNVPLVLDLCRKPGIDKRMDFNDMIWLPIVLDLPVRKYDILMGDEVQDWNRCQQALALKVGRRLILCGDVNQAIYGFAGADAESMQHLREELTATPQGCTVLPLTVTRRCGKAIVAEAQKIVPAFEAHESNGEGLVTRMDYSSYTSYVQDGDMLLCRVNAPLVSQCFRFLKEGRHATIQGKDVIAGLLSTIKKMKADKTSYFLEKLDKWYHAEVEKENRKRHPSDARLIALEDRVSCILVFAEGTETTKEIMDKINTTFTDDPNVRGIKLSSIHRAKGLEADRVFLLEPVGATVPHPMAKSQWQIAQEWNLRYVAITRAKKELVYVTGQPNKKVGVKNG